MATYDVATLQPVTGIQGNVVPALVTPTSSGRQITGIEKLTQRFMMEFLTELGSMPYNPNRGCVFLAMVKAGVASERQVFDAFNASMLQVTNNLQSEESPDDPDDERFAGAILQSLVVTPGVAFLNVFVQSRAEAISEISVPVSTVQ